MRWQWLKKRTSAGAARSVWKTAATGALGLCLMSGCALLEQTADVYRQPPAADATVPVLDAVHQREAYGQPDGGTDTADTAAGMGQWWKSLGSAEINALAEQVDAGNMQLRSGMVQVEQQRLQVLIDGAAAYPQVNASLGAAVRNARDPLKQQRSTTESYTAGVRAQWQADVFNRVGNTVSAGELQLEARQWDAVALRHTLISEAIRRHVASVFLHKRLVLAEQNVQSRQRTADIINTRYQKGVRRTDAAQVAASREAVLQTQSAVAGLEQARQQQQYALQVLKGELPGKPATEKSAETPVEEPKADSAGSMAEQADVPTGQTDALTGKTAVATPSLPDMPPARQQAAGVPADLLLRRPDVRAAAAQLRAAQYSALAALSSQYPTVGISGGVSGSGMRLSDALDVKQWVAQLGAELLLKLFDGGRAEKVTQKAQKQAEQLALNYAQAVLVAVREVEDALLAERTVNARVVLLRQRLEAAQRSEQVQQGRFERGTGDYLAFLDSQRSRVSAEDALLQAQEEAWQARIKLMLALGGSWTEEEAQLFARLRKTKVQEQGKADKAGAAEESSSGSPSEVDASVFGDAMRN